ncbi:MAG: hypothetical protein R3254_10020, partial [Thiomicrorhabdus sp.]|nr:hypothetical protein [Thiomicrorhabdus sp.]
MPFIEEIFPQATHIGEKQRISNDESAPFAWVVYQDKNVLGYAFETNDIAKIPAYSGEPVNMLVAID